MALSLDIRISNPLEKSAKATADALDEVAKREAKINAMLKRGLISQKLQKEIQKQFGAQKNAIVSREAKLLVEGKKKTAEDRKQLSWVKSITREYLFVKDAAKLAFSTIKKLTLDLMSLGKDALEAQTAALYEFNQWAGDNQGAKQMAEVDKVAHKLGMSLDEARGQFLKFRKASEEPLFTVSNADAVRLLKLRADIAAVSKSTRVADEEMDKLLSLVNQPAAFAKLEAQLRKTPKEFAKFGEIGSGEIAKALAPSNVDTAKKRLSDTVQGIGIKFWQDIGPTIGQAASKLADFADKFVKSKEFATIMKDIADTFKWLAKEGIPAVIDWVKKFAEAWVGMKDLTGQDVKNFAKDKVQDLSDMSKKFLQSIDDNFGSGLLRDLKKGVENFIVPPSPAQPTPSPSRPHGMLGTDTSRQLASNTVTIENITVQGGGSAEQIARSIRQEMQLLLRAGGLSRGVT